MNNFLIANYIKSAWRNILRHKLFSVINILGLAIGLAAVMLIALYVRYETSYDSFWKNADNIYRLHYEYTLPGQDPLNFAAAPPSVIGAMKENFPEIEEFARIAIFNKPIVNNGVTYTNSIRAVDPSFLDIFDFNVIVGDMDASIRDFTGIALSRSNAERIFGNKNPIGEIISIQIQNSLTRDYVVSAIFEDLPENSRLDITSLVAYSEADWVANRYHDLWYGFPFMHSYFTLKQGSDIIERLPEFIDRVFPPGPNFDNNTIPTDQVSLTYMNIQDLYLDFKGEREFTPRFGDKNSVIIFAIVALLILLIACFNFINLSTARATIRAKEVGVRKMVGAARKNLIMQFIGESVFLTFISLLIAFGLAEITLPIFINYTEKPIVIDYFSINILIFSITAMLIGFAGGVYPALIISAFHPSRVLKSNQSREDQKSSAFRNTLVLTQFSISIFLFVSTAVIYNQFRLIENYDYGYDKNNMLMTWGGNFNLINEKFETYKQRLLASPEIISVTGALNITFGNVDATLDPIRTEDIPRDNPVLMEYRGVNYDFFKTFDIPILAGRTFLPDCNDERSTYDEIKAGEDHTAALILNQLALRTLNLGTPEEALGKTIFMEIQGNNKNDTPVEAKFNVIGVVADVQHENLKIAKKPAFYQLKRKSNFYVILRHAGNGKAAFNHMEVIWKEEFPDTIFNPVFSEEALKNNYGHELNQMTMFAAFSGLAIFIACLGLFGLASFIAERRTKEIGIRKVFGAEVWQIVKMLVFQFSKPVLIANIIAWPIAYLAMSRWLESFVYRVDDMAIIALCLIAGLTALLIAWATVAGNSYAVARQNPIKALRYE